MTKFSLMSERTHAAAIAPCPAPAPADASVQAPAPGDAAARLYHLDAMRSVLMLLGVVLHALNPYAMDGDWLVADSQRSAALGWLGAAIHLFRMPAFFVVAGYFAMLMLRRSSATGFLHDRLRRTLLPALAVLLSFNLVQVWFLAPAAADGLVLRALLPALRSGDWLGHLWFLVDLAVYCMALAALRPWLRGVWGRRLHAALGRQWVLPALLALAILVPLANAAAAHLAPALAGQVAGLVNPEELLDYAPFFVAGCLLQLDRAVLRRFSRAGPGVWAGGALAGTALALPTTGAAALALAIVARALLAWCLVRIVFAGFLRFTDMPSRTFRYLSDASYSIYLFHHLWVVVVATWLLALPWPAEGKFAVVLGVATALALAMHHFLVRPFPRMRWLFNGRPPPRSGPG